MANGAYAKTVKKFLNGSGLQWTGTWKAILVDSSYAVDLAVHEYLSSISGIVATSAALTTLTVADDGILNADPALFTAVTGAAAPQLVVYHDTGVTGTSEIFLYFDTLSGLPVTPNGTNVTINWSTGTDKIFHI